jgi:amino acid adenylation domain-containing protein
MFIHNWFENIVVTNKDSIAISMGDKQLSYFELDQLSNQIANQLILDGVKPGDVVGVCLKRSPELVAGVLAILKTGAAYLPLDPEYPVDRLKYMVAQSEVKTILNHKEFSQLFQNSTAQKLVFENIDFHELSTVTPIIDNSLIDLCYVIYTSGSTGNPKGVALGHKALVNLIQWQNDQTRIKTGLSTLQFTPLSFDVHFQEVFSTLTTGGHLVLISEDTRLNPVKLLKTIAEKNIGRIFLPYVALNQLAETAATINLVPSCLKEVTTAGEQLKITPAIRSFFVNLSDAVLYNHYGPSETHVVTSHTLSGDPSVWPGLPPIGKAISNTKVLLLDSDMKSVKKGEEGDLYLGGICLANGYLNAPELTNERFLNHELLGRIYKAGDIGIEESDGAIQFLGRKDGQVKIRGYRIETGEIELVLQKQIGVSQGVVKVIEIENEKTICAYIAGSIDINSLRQKLRLELPEYMIPSHLLKLDQIPLTPSGKVDYKSLPMPSRTRPELMSDFVSPTTDLELSVAKLWKKYLALDEVGINDNFFDLGGNSLLAIRILIEMNQTLEKEVSVVDFFQNPTISNLINVIAGIDLIEFEADIAHGQVSGDVAIIGLSGRFPGADSVQEMWSNLLAGKNSVEKFIVSEIDSSIPAELYEDPNYLLAHGSYPGQDSFDYKFFGMTPREAELMDPQQRKFLEVAVEALESAGYHSDKHKETIGIFAGMGNSKYGRLVDQHPTKISQAGEFNVMLGLEKDYIATRVAYKLNFTGPAISLHTGCSTSLVAVVEAVKSLRLRNCTMALAGGIAISGAPKSGHLFQEGGILSHDGLCRPFDESASGTIFTEGAGIVVLKRLEDAVRDGDNILGVIKGIGLNNDGANKMSFTAPSSKGQADAIRKAHLDAKIDPRTISYIEAHGTATPVGDPIEVEALRQAFEISTKDKNFCYLSSVKSNLGHLTAAAGVTGLIKALLVINKGIVPGTVNFVKPNKLLNLENSPFIVSSESTVLPEGETPRRAGVSSFGVGGTNAHMVIEQYVIPENAMISEKRRTTYSEPTLFKISAKSDEQAKIIESNLIALLTNKDAMDWRKIAFTLEMGRKEYAHRRVLILNNQEDLKKVSPANSGNAQFKAIMPLYMMFPGQGSQYICMGKGLYNSSMIFKAEFDKCSELLEKNSGYSIKDLIFDTSNKEKLNNTYYTQPALFVIEYALARTFIEMGYKPRGLVGHSIGEYVAATIAGIFSLEDGLKVIAKRAELMMKLPSGTMLSVASKLEDIEKLINGFAIDIAAVNGPQSIVVAGEETEIVRFQVLLSEKNIGSVLLKTSHAFHSRMMTPVVSEFQKFLDGITKNAPTISIFSTVLVKQDDSALMSSAYWAEHIVKTVFFAPSISKLLSQENAALLEIGPKNTLVNLSRKQAVHDGFKNFKAMTSLSDNEASENFNVLKAIGELWLTGHKIKDSRLLFRNDEQKRTEAPVYVFEKNRVWLDSLNLKKITTSSHIPTESPMKDSKKEYLSKKLVDIFETSSGIEVGDYGNDITFLEMGMDSLFLTQISLQLKKDLKIQVTFRQLLEEYSTINALADAFIDKVALDMPELKISAPPIMIEQVQVQQKSQSPLAPPMVHTEVEYQPSSFSASASGVEQIIQRQLELMNQQILLLSNAKPSTSQVAALAPQLRQEVIPAAKELPAAQLETKKVVRGADIKASKDSFGAAAKISVEKTAKLTDSQNKMIHEFFDKYNAKNKESKKFTQDHRKTHADPRVVTGFKPENKEIIYPIVVKKSELQTLWDLDGNKYIDMTCGFGSNFFGNGNERIKKLVLKQIEEGIELGPQHPLVGEVSKLICDLTGNDRAAFCNTGSEAVLGAMRLARTVTGREKIICFTGSYHGINDEVIIRTARDKSYPAAPGINGAAVSNMIVLDYGTDESLRIIREMAGEVAGILVEPVQSRRCNFHPVEFLKELRKITTASETCLIFDEVITGFRIHPAGAQGHFGIRADLCTYGKIVGGGMPIGVISGKSEYMDALDGGQWQFGDDSTPTVGVTYFAGTFVRHPLALAAAKGALEIIRDGGVKMLDDLSQKATKFATEINTFCRDAKVPFEMHNFGALMKPKWVSDVAGGELLFAILRYNGVHVYDGFPWFINLAHTDKEIEIVLQSIKNGIATMQSMGLIPGSIPVNVSLPGVFDQKNPPVAGAKLGRDDKGNPAWFLENPEVPGEFYLIEG